MSAMEKRYFKVVAIDAQLEFDDQTVMEHVYKGEVISRKKYSELKGYLYDVILKTFQSFDEKSSISNKLANQMHNVERSYAIV